MAMKLEDLPAAVTELLEKLGRIENLLNRNVEKPNAIRGGLLNISEAGSLLDLSVNTLYKLVQGRKLPYSKKGKRLYFQKDELLAWVREGRKKTEAEVKEEAETGFINANKTCKRL